MGLFSLRVYILIFRVFCYENRQKKSRYFTVRLTVSVNLTPLLLLRPAFCDFFGLFFILHYDSMCSEMDFTPEKSFSSNYKNFQLLHVTKRSDSGIAEA